jgi:leucyl-tRNA synthetase
MGVTYMAVAAEHPLARRAAETNPGLAAFIEECRQGGVSEAEIETMEKKGHPLGMDAIHPVTGEPVPIYAANFVLMGYGTGAVMAVPAHDERDYYFARKYNLPIRPVVVPASWKGQTITRLLSSATTVGGHSDSNAAYFPSLSVPRDNIPVHDENRLDWSEGWIKEFAGEGILIDSGEFDGLTSPEALDAIAAWLARRGRGEKRVNFRLRDWGVSRQRYWGCPIPVVHTAEGGIRPETDLPVRLPEDVVVDGSGSPLKRMPSFSELPSGEFRETDTFDTFFESSWYYARYCSHDCATAMLDERARYWLPVDQYVGGIEHAVLHLLYARFFHKLMRDEGLVDCDEPFARLLTQGMVVAETWYREDAEGRKEWFSPADVEVARDDKGKIVSAMLKSDGQPVTFGGIEKMSKSKNNGVDPESLIERYGADTVRLYTMFTSPPDQSLEWNDDGVEGAYRFLKRLWALAVGKSEAIMAAGAVADQGMGLNDSAATARREVHGALKKALYDYERHQLNTVVSACMTMVNALYRLDDSPGAQAVRREGLSICLRLLGPIAPHVTHHLWRELGFGDDILGSTWPEVDERALARDTLEYVVQVNGKTRGKLEVPADADRAAVEAAALADETVRRFVGEATVRKVIVVPGKLVNVVAG